METAAPHLLQDFLVSAKKAISTSLDQVVSDQTYMEQWTKGKCLCTVQLGPKLQCSVSGLGPKQNIVLIVISTHPRNLPPKAFFYCSRHSRKTKIWYLARNWLNILGLWLFPSPKYIYQVTQNKVHHLLAILHLIFKSISLKYFMSFIALY